LGVHGGFAGGWWQAPQAAVGRHVWLNYYAPSAKQNFSADVKMLEAKAWAQGLYAEGTWALNTGSRFWTLLVIPRLENIPKGLAFESRFKWMAMTFTVGFVLRPCIRISRIPSKAGFPLK